MRPSILTSLLFFFTPLQGLVLAAFPQAEVLADLTTGSSTALDLIASAQRVVYGSVRSGEVLARGATWKGQFNAKGSTYVPFLGADAPCNYPVTFKLASATVGGEALRLAVPPVVSRSGNRVTIDHGPIHEVYDLSLDSIEQSFVLPKRARSGEVVVRMDVQSDLIGSADGENLQFAGASGGISYGKAFAFDNAGRTADVESSFAGNVIELRVPDTFPMDGDSALVIDPVISTIGVAGSALRARNADVAYEKDVDGGVYMVVYEVVFSATDRDVFSAEIVKATGAVQNVQAIDLSTDDYSAPRVAGNDGSNAFLIVSQVKAAGASGHNIVSRVRVAGTNLVSAPQLLNSAPGSANFTEPDVGGENLTVPGTWAVVWRRSFFGVSTIQGTAVASTGVKLGQVIGLSASGTVNDTQPTISEGNGSLSGGRTFNFAYTRGSAQTDRDVYTGQLTTSVFGLSIKTAPFSLGILGDLHSPSVSSLAPEPLAISGNRPWVLACVADATESDVVAFVLSGTSVHQLQNISTMESGVFTGSYSDPSVACTGKGFLLSYNSNDTTYMNSFQLTDFGTGAAIALAERRQLVSRTLNAEDIEPAMVSDWESGDFTSDKGAVVYSAVANFINFSDIEIGFIEELGGTPPVGSQYCQSNFNSTGNTGWLAAYGLQNPTGTKVLLGTDLPIGQFAFLVNSRQTGSVSNPGGSAGRLCLGGPIGRMFGTLTSVLPSGTAIFLVDPTELNTPTGLVAAQAGETWYFQAWHRDTVQGQATSNFTNALRLQFH